MDCDSQLENKTLKINLFVSIIFVIFSIIIVYFAQSLTVLLDTGYSVVSILLYAISIYVLRKINQPADKLYHYGYHRLEPIFIILESWFVLWIAISVILIAIFNIFTHVVKPNYGIALVAEIIVTAICFLMFLFVNGRAKKTGSKILYSDALLWKADAYLGLGVIFSVSIGYILEKLNFHDVAIYVDPVVAIFIGVYIMINPMKLAKEAYQHLLDAAPDPQFKRRAFSIAKKVIEDTEFSVSNIKITQSGRFIFIDVFLELPEFINSKEIRVIKSQIRKELNNCFSQYKLKVYIVI